MWTVKEDPLQLLPHTTVAVDQVYQTEGEVESDWLLRKLEVFRSRRGKKVVCLCLLLLDLGLKHSRRYYWHLSC